MLNGVNPNVGRIGVDEYGPVVYSKERAEKLHNAGKISDETYFKAINNLEKTPQTDSIQLSSSKNTKTTYSSQDVVEASKKYKIKPSFFSSGTITGENTELNYSSKMDWPMSYRILKGQINGKEVELKVQAGGLFRINNDIISGTIDGKPVNFNSTLKQDGFLNLGVGVQFDENSENIDQDILDVLSVEKASYDA